jgi:hypothetical protein
MLARIRQLPSPALVISAIALVVAIGGGSYAIASLTGAKVKKIARKQADREIKRKAHGLSVAHASAAENATHATSADTAKSADTATRADTAANATNATNATTVGGMTVQKFSAKPLPNTALTTIATTGTLDLRVGCEVGGNPLFEIAPANGAAPQGVRGSFDDGSTKSNTIAAGSLAAPDKLTVLGGTIASASGEINAATSAGLVTTIHFAARNAFQAFPGGGNPDPGKCFFYGTGVSG